MSQNVQLDYALRLTMEITGADNVSVSIHEEKLALKNVGDNGFLKRKEEFQACFAFPGRIKKAW